MSRQIVNNCALLCFSLVFLSCGSNSQEPRPRLEARQTVFTVGGVVVTTQHLDNIVVSSGTVLASESVDLAAEADGRIDSILFREGAHVRKNDLLLKINDDDLRAQLKKVKVQLRLASDQAERQKKLFESNNVSKEQYEIAISQVGSLQADHDNLLAAIRKREIRAPFDGIIGLRSVSEGGFVSATTRIAGMQKINPLKVDFAIPEKYVGKVFVGDIVQFSSDETKQRFMGRVYAIEPKIAPSTRTLQLRALCENKSEAVYPGGYVRVELRLNQTTNALLVPTQAIIPVLKGQTVLLVKNGVVVSVPVKTGVRMPTVVQVTEGLAVGDTVITTGILQLRPGMPVNVSVR